ncbi:MAG: hypothetical protein JWQ11_5 [Rhizobacter sp.]|nr:hypothetical protein [Rhizobacter sp.]
MSVYLEMAKRLRQEIADAQEHLDRLNVALRGLEPLITIDAKPSGPLGIEFEPRSGRRSARTVMAEVLDVVPNASVDKPVSDATSSSAASNEAPATPRRRGPGRPKVQPVGAEAPAAKKTRRGRKPADAHAATGSPSDEAAGDAVPPRRRPRSATSTVVPSTGGSYWVRVMGKRKHTLADVVDKAIADLGVPPDTYALLANRLSAWLYPALKAGRIEEAGNKGRNKLYRVVG